MRIFAENIDDDLFVTLWAAKGDQGNCDLKRDLKITKKGICKKEVLEELKNLHQKFQQYEIKLDYYNRLEKFFDINFGIIKVRTKKLISFDYISDNWDNMKFVNLQQKKRKLYYYIKLDIKTILPLLARENSIIKLPFKKIFQLFNKEVLDLPLCYDNWDKWCQHLDQDVLVYDINKDGKIYMPGNNVSPGGFIPGEGDKAIKLIVNDREFFEEGGAEYRLLANEKLFVNLHKCTTKGCGFADFKKFVVVRHQKSCTSEYEVTTKQLCYGNPESMLEKGIRLGYLPKECKNFRQKYLATFDIECLETDFDGDRLGMAVNIEKCQKLVSIAVGSNLPGSKSQFFCRTSSHFSTEQILVDEFLDHLDAMYYKYLTILPSFIESAVERIKDDLTETKFSHRKTELQAVLTHLRGYQKLRVYGFNSSMFINHNSFYFPILTIFYFNRNVTLILKLYMYNINTSDFYRIFILLILYMYNLI